MAKIRTVKPDLFRHPGLFAAEAKTGLPLRLAFIGLFTACDREGRFCWVPETLKLDCLPFDQVDFAAVMDALEGAGLIRSYVVDGKKYGEIPTWKKHQHVNAKECPSRIPVNSPDAPSEFTGHGQGIHPMEVEVEVEVEKTKRRSPPKGGASPDQKAFTDFFYALHQTAHKQKPNPTQKAFVRLSQLFKGGMSLFELKRRAENYFADPYLAGHDLEGFVFGIDKWTERRTIRRGNQEIKPEVPRHRALTDAEKALIGDAGEIFKPNF